MSTIESINTFKQLGSCRLVSNSNQSVTYFNGPTNNGVGATITYATGALTIDSVVVNLNDYVLFAGQTLGYENGIYQCIQAGATGVAAILQRRGDFQCIEQIKGGQYVPVAAGTVDAGSLWVVVEPFPAAIGVPIVSGANNIVFVNSGTASAGSFLVAANNLSDVANAATSLSNLGGVPLAGGQMTGQLLLDRGVATSTAGAATINHQSGIVTTEALTTAAASAYAFTYTDSRILSTSNVIVSLLGGTNTTRGIEVRSVVSAGSAAISFFNNNVAGTALNGTLIFGVLVI